MSVYLLHFDRPISEAHTTQHYVGWTPDLMPRIYAHLHGKGARLTEVAYERGIGFTVVRVWEDGDRHFERRIKNRHNSPELCPICRGLVVQLPLLAGEPAYTPDSEVDEAEPRPYFEVDIAQFALFPETSYFAHLYSEPYDAQEWEDHHLDVEWLRTGC